MGTWRKWAGFGVWCVVLFGGMILAGTGLWPLGAAAAAVGAVGVLLGSRGAGKVGVGSFCGAGLYKIDFSRAKRNPDGGRSMRCPVCGAIFPPEAYRKGKQ